MIPENLGSQILTLFDELSFIVLTKYNNFLWVYWFLVKNLALKFHKWNDIIPYIFHSIDFSHAHGWNDRRIIQQDLAALWQH